MLDPLPRWVRADVLTTGDLTISGQTVPGEGGRAKMSGWEVDSISTTAAYNVIVDHCSATWGTDTSCSTSSPKQR